MTRNITRVQWSATELPWGIKFDETNGILSVTPTDVGEYIVSVKVKTNYGSDMKDVEIVVVHAGEHAGKVYAIGADAERWSNNAAPDMYGFRELPIPRCTKLVRIPTGFAAKTISGSWYIATTRENELDIFGEYGGDYYTNPQEYPVTGIDDMGGGRSPAVYTSASSPLVVYFAYKRADEITIHKSRWSPTTKKFTAIVSQSYQTGVKVFPNDFMLGMLYGTEGGIIQVENEVRQIDTEQEVAQVSMWASSKSTGTCVYYVTEDGELYEVVGTGNPQQLLPEAGRVSYIYNMCTQYNHLSVITEAGDVYAKGTNTDYCLGLPTNNKTYSDLTLVGNFNNAKKISGRYLLTEDGSLYHTGKVLATESINYKFNRIYPQYNFYDIAYLGTPSYFDSETLVCIKED